jgi:TetR/AcrR family transcriptional regulator, transcriptional repressor of aconitase
MPKTSEAAKEARRSQILDAAVRCFARTGYYATTIEDIVRETGVSKGALYLYFPSKEALYLAISERWNGGRDKAIHAQLTPDLTPTAVLRVVIEVTGEYVQAEADACRVLIDGWNLGLHIPALAERAQEQEAASLSTLTQLLHSGIAEGEFRADMVVDAQARLLLATLHGLMVQWHRQPDSVAWTEMVEELLRGLHPR